MELFGYTSEAFKQVNYLITRQPVLKYFDNEMDVVMPSDASESGLGGTIMQEGQPNALA